MDDYRILNKANWDERAPAHAASPGYAIDRFVADPEFLSDVVAFDLPLLGDLSGVRGVHLQCHIGTDTISLARLGARMTGLDFSSASIAEARKLNDRLQAGVDFVESDVYDARQALGDEQFDLVFTGIGAIGWLPSIERWAQTVSSLLKPGGRFFIREGHPVLWTIDEKHTDALVAHYAYFETEQPLVFDEGGTYVETDHEFVHTVTHEWNHGMGEIVTALLDNGLELTGLTEHKSIPWEGLPGQMVRTGEFKEWMLAENQDRIPLSYTLQARKRR